MNFSKTLSAVIGLSAMLILTGSARADHHTTKDIVDTAIEAGSFTTLVKAVQAADLVAALKGDGPFTVFAPTDAAFGKVPAETLAALLKPENKEQLRAVLTYHVVAGAVMADDVVNLDSADTLNGESLHIQVKDGAVMINNAEVVKADIPTSNGVIHVIDTVILPANLGDLSD